MIEGDDRLQRLLGGDALASLRRRLRQRFERGPVDGKIERLRVSNLSRDEHAALAGLMGRPARFSSSMQLDVQTVDAALSRAGIAMSLREALESIDGPIIHAETARAELKAGWSKAISVATQVGLASFLQTPFGVGLLKRLSNSEIEVAARLCSRADIVLKLLPVKGMTRAQLAARCLGDAHALDRGQAVATLVLAVWRKLSLDPDAYEENPTLENGRARENGEDRIRDIWAKAGVLVNELARPALFLNLQINGNHTIPLAPGEPSYASLRFLLRTDPLWNVRGRDIYVCENPNLLAIAADKLGVNCAPMVCTDGMPAAAQRTIMQQLVIAGGRLRYHGDFDWPGLRIGNHVMREFGAVPWRFDAKEYLVAVARAPSPDFALTGPDVHASWDEALTAAMRTHGLAIAEESLADELLQDLAR
ncbi:TIGR02679 family protein [Bradyrhizobium brasilense]|uniref:TIGR02679 family protein n=1 Tax=Bradyrhizobium brasilense TaxID=1419277 RepID=A0A1G7MF65_9BRAD|nr:TIGR02679 family protein [Bradyrhizobium brasilense]SDF60316.1 TIGR02679 family protein [Bradyrhizobium brasilense]